MDYREFGKLKDLEQKVSKLEASKKRTRFWIILFFVWWGVYTVFKVGQDYAKFAAPKWLAGTQEVTFLSAFAFTPTPTKVSPTQIIYKPTSTVDWSKQMSFADQPESGIQGLLNDFSFPTGSEIVAQTGQSYAEWDQMISSQARNLAIPKGYRWAYARTIAGTTYKDVEKFYVTSKGLEGYKMLISDEGMNEVYLLKMANKNSYFIAQFNGGKSPTILLFQWNK